MRSMHEVPWWGKIAVKSAIGLLPVSYEKLRAKITGYQGEMTSPEFARNTFDRFVSLFVENGGSPERSTLLELGPGGSLFTGMYARAEGFERTILIDVGDFATRDTSSYRECADVLSNEDRARFLSVLDASADVIQALAEIGVEYHTNGVSSLKELRDESVDYSFSNAVLEHVRKFEFDDLACELFRTHRPGSLSAHQVDFRDHLGGGLNNLRFSERVWESRWFPTQAFYTNRLRHNEVCEKFAGAGFEIVNQRVEQWSESPLEKKRMALEFQGLSDFDLTICSSLVAVRKAFPA